MKGYLKLVVLIIINKKAKRGYQILEESFQIYNKKPSGGSLYPILERLERDGYIFTTIENNGKLYNITEKGKYKINKLKKDLSEKINDIMKFTDLIIDYEAD